MPEQTYIVRNAKPAEFEQVGQLMVLVYSQLEGFPKESEQPDYYKVLAAVGKLTDQPGTELLIAVTTEGKIAHTTMAMQTAWKMYENLGFKRSEDLDFRQGELSVFGFRLLL
jgi:hypothetical protein